MEQPQSRPLPRIQIKYREEVAPALIQEFEYTTPMQVPALSKIVLNMGARRGAGKQQGHRERDPRPHAHFRPAASDDPGT